MDSIKEADYILDGIQTRKAWLFKAPAPFYSVWNDVRNIEILELGYSWKIPANIQVSQMQPVGLGVIENDDSGWVNKQGAHGFFHASSDFTS